MFVLWNYSYGEKSISNQMMGLTVEYNVNIATQ